MVRPATAADAAAIAAVAVRSWREGYRGIVPERIDPVRAWDPAGIAARLEAPGEHPSSTLVAEVGGRITGFVVLGACRDSDVASAAGEVWALYVDPDHWRRGVGRQLVEAALDGLAAAGHAEATVWTLGESERNLRFYEALGFRRDGATQRRESFGSPLEVRLRTGLLQG
ncbi:MAG: GNAT family N-acetyltransferase [Solirubrobacterales bacterium]